MLTALLLLTILPAFAMIGAAQTANPADDPTAEIIALEKAMLDRWGTGDTYSFIELAAPEITYFDPSLEKRLNGRSLHCAKPRSPGFNLLFESQKSQKAGVKAGSTFPKHGQGR